MESEAFHDCSGQLCNTSVLLGSYSSLIVSLTLSFCFFRVSLSCFDLAGSFSALRMIYPRNPQSHSQYRSSLSSCIWPNDSTPFSRVFSLLHSFTLRSGFRLYDLALTLATRRTFLAFFLRICFAKLSRVHNLLLNSKSRSILVAFMRSLSIAGPEWNHRPLDTWCDSQPLGRCMHNLVEFPTGQCMV